MAIKSRGFTIVELLIVIVVIAILAAITIVAFNGIQQRARDSRRANDVASILKALESYKVVNGGYPTATSTAGSGSFEQSTDTSGTFMEYLTPQFFSQAPVDPVNDTNHYYRYYLYNAGSYGCPPERGKILIFQAIGFENSANVPQSDDALVCPSRSWGGNSTMYFKYRFENG